MIEIKDLSFREWEYFEHSASWLGENGISHVWAKWSIRSTEMVEAENLDLVPDVTDFQDVSGKKTVCYQLVTRQSSQIMEMIEAENLDLVAYGQNYSTARKCRRKHFQHYLRSCLEYALVKPSVGISNRCCLPFWT